MNLSSVDINGIGIDTPLLGRSKYVNSRIIRRAKGFYLIDDKGNSYLDAISGAYASIFGYENPDIINTIVDVAKELPFVHNARFNNWYAEILSKNIIKHIGNDEYLVYFSVSGSDGVESAIRIARLYHLSKQLRDDFKIASLQYSYHGSTAATLDVTQHLGARYGFEKIPSQSLKIDAPVHHKSLAGQDDEKNNFSDLERKLDEANKNGLGAFIIEPVLGNAAGSMVMPDGFLQFLSNICRKKDILLICDEVTTGIGRTGAFLASEASNIWPDMIILGKALTAGYFPLSAVLIKKRVIKEIKKEYNFLGHTHSAHPIGAAIGTRTLEKLSDISFRKNKAEIEKKLLDLKQNIKNIPRVIDFHGKGLLWSIALDHEFFIKKYKKNGSFVIYEKCLENGLLVMPGTCISDNGIILSDHLTIAPAFSMKKNDISTIFDILESVLSKS